MLTKNSNNTLRIGLSILISRRQIPNKIRKMLSGSDFPIYFPKANPKKLDKIRRSAALIVAKWLKKKQCGCKLNVSKE